MAGSPLEENIFYIKLLPLDYIIVKRIKILF